MRRLAAPLLLCVALLATPTAIAAPTQEYYRVSITRIDGNVYQDATSRLLILTNYCYEYTYSEDAVLKYEPYSYSNQLIFDSGNRCPVRGVYRANAELRRVSEDLYRDSISGGYLKTFGCYVYAYGEPALVLSDKAIFIQSRETCDLAW